MKKKIQKKIFKKRLHPFHKMVLICGLLLASALFFHTVQQSLGDQIIILPPLDVNYSSQPNLQLRTFLYITVAPTIPVLPTSVPTNPPAQPNQPIAQQPVAQPVGQTGGNSCQGDAPKIGSCTCPASQAVTCPSSSVTTCGNAGGFPSTNSPASFAGGQCSYLQGSALYTQNVKNSSCQVTCYSKPVIYLYPTKTTAVSVKLTIPGTVTKSIPQYPTTGWQHVEAHPDGTLLYQGNIYHELFYETSVTQKETPSNGIVIPTNELQGQLTSITTQLGLSPSEQKEFLEYWMPRLLALHSQYILFSILSSEQKNAVDSVSISPKPDTEIEFLAYFKPLSLPLIVQPLVLPSTPPVRKGFTSVEWGGTIDN